MKKTLLSFLIICGFSAIAHALTLADIETQVRRAVNDNATAAARQTFSDAVIDAYINEGQRDFASRTRSLQKSTGIALISGTTYYSLPDDFVSMIHLVYVNASSNTLVLGEETRTKMYQEYPNWIKETNGPTTYFLFQDSDNDNIEIAVFPIPNTSSTGTLTAYYYNSPADLSSDSDIPFDGYQHLSSYHFSLVYYTAAHLFMLLKDYEGANQSMAFYEASISISKTRLGESPNYFPSSRSTSSPRPRNRR